MKNVMVVIDGNSLLFRAFYAVPPTLKAPDGTPTNAVYGFLNTYLRILKEFDPTYVVVAMDEHAPTFRHEFFSGYKATRRPTPPEFIEQGKYFLPLLAQMNVAVSSCRGYEADDVLGRWSAACDEKGIECLLVTGDRDSLQLITDNTNVILAKNLPGGGTDLVRYDKAAMAEKYGMTPEQFIDLKALMGDASDNIPGVKGIGETTGVKLIGTYASLDGVYAHLDEIKGKLGEKLAAGRQDAYDSRYLATIVRDVPIEPDWEAARRRPASAEARHSFVRFGFASLIGKFEFENGSSAAAPQADGETPAHTETVLSGEDLRAAIGRIRDRAAVLIAEEITLYDGKTLIRVPVKTDLLGDGLTADEALDGLAPLLADTSVGKITAETKKMRYLLDGRELADVVDDVCLAEYLIDSVTQDYSLKRLAGKYLGKFEGAPDAFDLWRIAERENRQLDAAGMGKLYRELELPLERVLYEMEKAGFAVDREELIAAGREMDGQIAALNEEILALAGETFDINSPKQLGVILFEKLGLTGVKKNKNGSYPTDAETLEKAADQHEIVDKILDYRKLTKLRNTYVEGLLTALERSGDGRIHTHFMTTATATGRLSSAEPNLQNIPVRTARGKELRRAFSASPGCVLVDADYSQIELRVMAHMAHDENMLKAFADGKDIHASTAARVMGVPLSAVTPQMRADAKAVNFGIIYGISEFGLAKNIGVARWKAGEFISRYFAEYPGIRRFTEEAPEAGERDGYVSTLFGRRREMRELTSSNYNERQFGKRVAVNMPVQGTAADIIKVAMLRIDRRLRDENLRARMIMQIHDEIILDTPRDEADRVAALVKECMENAVKLDVALKVDVSVAENWYDCK
ncbi:MAG: DNA polymerase I [Eubacteriales bacterium]|nr:DNA polymerase I [Eubacteriales bacterium]